MKKCLLIVFTVLFLIGTVVFFSLWQRERASAGMAKTLAQANAVCAYESFQRYAETGKESDYMNGAAEFHTFTQIFCHVMRTDSFEQAACNEVYAYMTISPDKVKAHMEELLDALEILSQDCYHANGYQKLSNLEHHLAED